MNGHKREADTATETMEEKKGKLDHGEKVEEEVGKGGGGLLKARKRRGGGQHSSSERTKLNAWMRWRKQKLPYSSKMTDSSVIG